VLHGVLRAQHRSVKEHHPTNLPFHPQPADPISIALTSSSRLKQHLSSSSIDSLAYSFYDGEAQACPLTHSVQVCSRQAVAPVLNTPAAVPSNQSATSSEHRNPLSSDRSGNQSAEHPDDDSAAAEAPQVTHDNAGTSTNAEGNKKKAKTETEPVDSTADTPFQQFFLEVGRAREKEFNSATLPTRYGMVSETELDTMLDGPKDSRWTDADEAELMSKWNASQLKKDIKGKKYNSVTYLRRF